MAWPARCGGDTRLDPRFRRRRNIGSANTCEVAARKGCHQIIKPIDIGHAVGIGVGKNFAPGCRGPGVACSAQSAVRLMYVTYARKFGGNLCGIIIGSVINQNNLKFRVIDFAKRFEASAQGCSSVIGTNNNRDRRRLSELTVGKSSIVLSKSLA